MKLPQALELVRDLASWYPKADWPLRTIRVWAAELARYDQVDVEQAIREWHEHSRTSPEWIDFRERVEVLRDNRLAREDYERRRREGLIPPTPQELERTLEKLREQRGKTPYESARRILEQEIAAVESQLAGMLPGVRDAS